MRPALVPGCGAGGRAGEADLWLGIRSVRYRPGDVVCNEKSEPRAPKNKVFRSGPPKARLPGRSGISTTPICRPPESKI